MKPGSLVHYQNNYNRIPQPLIGIIIGEFRVLDTPQRGISKDQRYFNVLLENGTFKLIWAEYLDFLQ